MSLSVETVNAKNSMSNYETLISKYYELTYGYFNEMLLDDLNEKLEELEECLDLSID